MDLPGEIRSHAEELLRRFCETGTAYFVSRPI
jgi:hypothetical protein